MSGILMSSQRSRSLFEQIKRPQFQLESPSRILSEADFDLLRITVEDFRFVTREITRDLSELAADIRARSTILRRLLCHSDIYNLARIIPSPAPLRVTTRMLDFEPTYPSVIISCGNYPWAGDRLEGIAIEFNIKGVAPLAHRIWSYRDNAEVTLSEYMKGLALAVLGVRVSRGEIVKYVADKKAAHVSDQRKHLSQQAIDRTWSQLGITITNSEGDSIWLSVVYLEVLTLIEALARSESINRYIDEIADWLGTAKQFIPQNVKSMGISIPMSPVKEGNSPHRLAICHVPFAGRGEAGGASGQGSSPGMTAAGKIEDVSDRHHSPI
jgi:hypothetical protein